MKRLSYIFGLIAILSLATAANASLTWDFTSNPQQVANGTPYSNSVGTITPYAEQVDNSTNKLMTTPVQDGGVWTYNAKLFRSTYSGGTTTESGLFSTNTSKLNKGSGIGPFDPTQGGTVANGFKTQSGIDDNVSHNSTSSANPSGGSYGNILELQLGSDIAQGTLLNFLMQGPTIDPGTGQTTEVKVYYGDGTGGVAMNPSSMTFLGTFGGISTNGTTPQFSLTKNTGGIEWIAIEADCNYLLLNSITDPPSGVPEPRFYGLLLVSLLGFAGIYFRNRKTAQPNA